MGEVEDDGSRRVGKRRRRSKVGECSMLFVYEMQDFVEERDSNKDAKRCLDQNKQQNAWQTRAWKGRTNIPAP